jgi:hypothetical protein
MQEPCVHCDIAAAAGPRNEQQHALKPEVCGPPPGDALQGARTPASVYKVTSKNRLQLVPVREACVRCDMAAAAGPRNEQQHTLKLEACGPPPGDALQGATAPASV